MNRLTIAVEALKACAEVGLNVADHIAVVGCDDRMFVSLLSPALTTLRSAPQTQNTESAGRIVKLEL
jgi:DNA-binding LacI/PurR family transcriptional regulator